MKIFQAFSAALLGHNTDTLFGLMGDANMVYVGDFRERGGRFIATSHESSAVGMADSWSRATGRVGVATVTCGPGLSNTLSTLVEAVKAGSQVLLLTGDAPGEPTHWQQLDPSKVAAAAGAGYEQVLRPEAAVRGLNRAMQRVVAERRPVVLNLPQDMLLLDAGEQQPVKLPVRRSPATPDADQLDAALGLIASAKRPVILAGRGALVSGAHDSLLALAELLAAPLATTVLAKDLFQGHPSNLGICGNMSHSVATTALSDADCIVAFGASLNNQTSFNGELFSGKKIVQVDDDPGGFGWYTPVDEAVTGDADVVARMMTEALREFDHTAGRGWLEKIQDNLGKYDPRDDYQDRSTSDTVDIRTASIRMNEVLPEQRNVVSDIGRFIHAAWPHVSASPPAGFTAMGAFASVGLGLGGAIGMAVARPDVPTVLVIGDGGLMMNPAELATAVRERLPLIVVVFDDGAYGFEWHKMIGFGADPKHSLVAWPEISGVAEGMGAKAVTVRKLEDLDEVGPLAERLDGPLVVVVKLDPTVNIVP